jgi:hypothetical protein
MLKTTDRVFISFVLSSLTIIEVLTEEKRLRMRHPCERDVKCSEGCQKLKMKTTSMFCLFCEMQAEL